MNILDFFCENVLKGFFRWFYCNNVLDKFEGEDLFVDVFVVDDDDEVFN